MTAGLIQFDPWVFRISLGVLVCLYGRLWYTRLQEVDVVTFEDIREFSQALIREFHPHRVLLFGSHANGTAREDSDVDLLVTMEYKGNSLRTAGQMLRTLQPKFAVDLIVRTETELRERIRQNDGFLKEATTNGRTLYEATN